MRVTLCCIAHALPYLIACAQEHTGFTGSFGNNTQTRAIAYIYEKSLAHTNTKKSSAPSLITSLRGLAAHVCMDAVRKSNVKRRTKDS
jgi:hypothetical protein